MFDLKRFREDEKIKQKELCSVLGIAQPYLSAIENKNRPLNEEKISLLYKQYGNIILDYKDQDVVIKISDTDSYSPKKNIVNNLVEEVSSIEKLIDIIERRDIQFSKAQEQMDRLIAIIERQS